MTNRERWIQNDRKLDQLRPGVRHRFEDTVKAMESAGWKPYVVETRRSYIRQLYLRTRGLTRTLHSKHLTGTAMDLIDHDFAWSKTPLGFMADLAHYSHLNFLTTGLLWEMKPTDRAILQQMIETHKVSALKFGLARFGHGFDPCHVEVSE